MARQSGVDVLGFCLGGLAGNDAVDPLALTFSEASVNPSFLRTTPAKKPRTECCCQPVAFMIAAIVTPLGCSSSARTAACLVSPRVEREGVFPVLTGFFVRLLVCACLVLLGVLLCD